MNLSLSPRLRLPQPPTIPGALRTHPIGRSTNRSNTMPSPLITLLSSLNIPNIRLERITPTPNAHLSKIPSSILSLSKTQMRSPHSPLIRLAIIFLQNRLRPNKIPSTKRHHSERMPILRGGRVEMDAERWIARTT